VEFLQGLGVWDETGLIESIERLLTLYARRKPLLIHGNYLTPAMPIPSGASVIYCPRTHAAFGQPPHPFRELLSRGIRVALGTDSLASNPDLDMLAEARFLHQRYPEVSPAALLRMATLSGAEALGWEQITGSLTVRMRMIATHAGWCCVRSSLCSGHSSGVCGEIEKIRFSQRRKEGKGAKNFP
jgi:hypothetical protein